MWFCFQGMNQIRELDGISDEEDGQVIAYNIVVALLGIELRGESPHVPYRVCRSSATGDSGEPDEDRRLLAWVLQEFGRGVFSHGFVNLEISEGSRAFGMHDPLWNPLPIE